MGDTNQKSDETNGQKSESRTSLLGNALKGLAIVRKREQEQVLKTRHDKTRTVSWDETAGPPQPPEEGCVKPLAFDVMAQVTAPGGDEGAGMKSSGWNKLKRLSLRDVARASPLESEAETYIQRALDDLDPTEPGTSEAQKAILNGVPDHVQLSFPTDSQSQGEHETHERSSTKAPATTERLFGLTAGLYQLDNDDDNIQSSTLVANPDTASETGAFATIASGISNRLPKQPTVPDPRKWQTTKRASTSLQASGADKKTDKDRADADIETGDPISVSNINQIPKRRKFTLPKAHTIDNFWAVIRLSKTGMISYCKRVLAYLIIPATVISSVLFYLCENPPCGNKDECSQSDMGTNSTSSPGKMDSSNPSGASVSWWLLFVFVRQVITLSLAKVSQVLVIDLFCQRSPLSLKVFGPVVSLVIIQSKGFPFLLVAWSAIDFFVLYGKGSFASHWLFWQSAIGMFNDENPAGDVVGDGNYFRVLVAAIVFGIAVSFKRFKFSLTLGRKTFSEYAPDLAVAMENNLLIGQVATLARDIEKLCDAGKSMNTHDIVASDAYETLLATADEESSTGESSTGPNALKTMKSGINGLTGENDFVGSNLTGSHKIALEKALGDFEEPRSRDSKDEDIPIKSLIQFRRSLFFLNTPYPFSLAFGRAASREECITSTQNVFHRLMLSHPKADTLQFDTLALLAVRPDGSLDETKLKDLIRLFRPDRQGNLTLLDFAKSIDSCYKKIRLLRASVVNATRVYQAFESVLNFFFYFLLGYVTLAILGVDPVVLFASVTGLIVGFSFMIGAAASKYFEGLLLILVRKPYDIGDRIAVSDVNNDTDTAGSTTWFVRDVTLVTTTVVLAASNELATYSNGALASSRIINAARSPEAILFFLLKFPINTPYEKLKVLRRCIEQFVNARPRQWIALTGFRATVVEADLGYVEYTVIAQHRESWQNVGALVNSKADLSSFALELTKKMNMRYRPPSLPVDLSLVQGDRPPGLQSSAGAGAGTDDNDNAGAADGTTGSHQSHPSMDVESISAMFDKLPKKV